MRSKKGFTAKPAPTLSELVNMPALYDYKRPRTNGSSKVLPRKFLANGLKCGLDRIGVSRVGADANGLSPLLLDLGNNVIVALWLSGQESNRVGFGKAESDAAARAAADAGDDCVE